MADHAGRESELRTGNDDLVVELRCETPFAQNEWLSGNLGQLDLVAPRQPMVSMNGEEYWLRRQAIDANLGGSDVRRSRETGLDAPVQNCLDQGRARLHTQIERQSWLLARHPLDHPCRQGVETFASGQAQRERPDRPTAGLVHPLQQAVELEGNELCFLAQDDARVG